jgi:hypothetical protein
MGKRGVAVMVVLKRGLVVDYETVAFRLQVQVLLVVLMFVHAKVRRVAGERRPVAKVSFQANLLEFEFLLINHDHPFLGLTADAATSVAFLFSLARLRLPTVNFQLTSREHPSHAPSSFVLVQNHNTSFSVSQAAATLSFCFDFFYIPLTTERSKATARS